MTPAKNLNSLSPVLVRRALIGGVIALVLISVFLISAGDPDPSWPKLWRLRPLIIVPLAGIAGGVCYHLLDELAIKHGWNKFIIRALSVVIYIIGFWLGFVLGLDGTMWN